MDDIIGLVSATLGLVGGVVGYLKRREEAKLLDQIRPGESPSVSLQSSTSSAYVSHQDGKVSLLIIGVNTLGASPNNSVVLQNPTVSGSHATLNHKQSGDVVLSDVGSRNGSYVNGQRITEPRKLQDGDILAFGSWQGIFHRSSPNSE